MGSNSESWGGGWEGPGTLSTAPWRPHHQPGLRGDLPSDGVVHGQTQGSPRAPASSLVSQASLRALDILAIVHSTQGLAREQEVLFLWLL